MAKAIKTMYRKSFWDTGKCPICGKVWQTDECAHSVQEMEEHEMRMRIHAEVEAAIGTRRQDEILRRSSAAHRHLDDLHRFFRVDKDDVWQWDDGSKFNAGRAVRALRDYVLRLEQALGKER